MELAAIASSDLLSGLQRRHGEARTTAERAHGERPPHTHADGARRGHGKGLGRGHAIDVFRQELRAALRVELRGEVRAGAAAYAATRPADAATVVDETLAAARRLVRNDPADAPAVLARIRGAVDSAAIQARGDGAADAPTELDGVVAGIDDGL
ncbi:MAG: hypothetical protein RLW62_08465, partial [Gammaproteobacteria bacterium]